MQQKETIGPSLWSEMRKRIEARQTELGFKQFGFAELSRPSTLLFYENWLKNGYAAEMTYLAKHLPQKADPQLLWPQAKSAIVLAFTYVPEHPSPLETDLSLTSTQSQAQSQTQLQIAKYARGQDYHFWLKARMNTLIQDLQTGFPDVHFACFTDSSPVLERDLAAKAGLGWFGKNTSLIDRKTGSFHLLGEIFTSLANPPVASPSPDFCGTCNRCIEACPTQALLTPKVLDANRCISYWTIESRQVPPVELREHFAGWFFGCDICQDVCPWNQKFLEANLTSNQADKASTTPDLLALSQELRELLQASNKALERRFAQTPLSRPGGFGLKRNALLLVAHYQLKDLASDVDHLRKTPGKLQELAQWTWEKLTL